MPAPPVDDQAESFAQHVAVQRLLVVKLATLRRIVQRSASLAFGRETGLSDFDWLVVWFIGTRERPVAADIGECLQRDKGQVSRAVTRLTQLGLVKRDHLRAPVVPTERGEEIRTRIERLVASRNHALLDGVTEEQRAMLDDIVGALFKSAHAMLEHERRLERGEDGGRAEGDPTKNEKERPWRASLLRGSASAPPLLAPDLYLLLRLLQRSADLGYNRVTGLSNFDWRLLVHIAMNGPLTLSDLIVSVDRNKSQVGRAVERLAALGLVARTKETGVASVVLATTPAGKTAFAAIAEETKLRDAALVEELTVREYRALQLVLDRLTENALGLLARERGVGAEAAAAGRVRPVPSDED